ncbi:zinc finger protein [Cinnamomum micranthum f. kanehirae]|uniref:Zinc finger protein n=1 Tax=Cinnamomum micranthum f. kanehirae TaxID=337451 RepID=A0A3S3R3E0_9MAGN|nr:zinc finger protein [Cinnamomum micranthum f. kanehirae]
MANGKPPDDSEEFVLRSGPRSGLKREFAFALKVHSEVSGSLGRTRSRKIQSPSSSSSNGVSADGSSKKIKISGADEGEESKKSGKRIRVSGVDDVNDEESKTNGMIQSPSSFNEVSVDLSDNRTKTYENSSGDDAMGEESKRESEKRETLMKEEVYRTETFMEVEDTKIDLEEIPIEKEGSVAETCIEVEDKKSVIEEIPDMNENSGTETDMVVEDSNVEKVVDGDAEKTMLDDAKKAVGVEPLKALKASAPITFSRRFTRSVAEKNVDGKEGKMVNGNVLKTTPASPPPRRITRLNTEKVVDGEAEKMVGDEAGKIVDDNGERMVDDNVEKMVDGSVDMVVDVDMKNMVDGRADMVVDVDMKNIVDGKASKTPLSPTTARRLTWSVAEKIVDCDAEKMVESDGDKRVDENAVKMLDNHGDKKVDETVEKMLDNDGDKRVDDNAEKTVDSNASKTPLLPTPARRFTRSIAEKMVDGDAEKMVESNGDKMAEINGDKKMDDNAGKVLDGNALKTSPPHYTSARRITRSLLKSNTDSLISTASEMDGVCAVSGPNIKPRKNEAVVESDAKTADEVSPLGGSSKKLELKMSKKIALTKMPSNIRDLLRTGLLEGFPVKYVFRSKKAVLKGIIKGDGILCSCSSCNGSKVVLPFEFEKHADSLNKHPSMYIHFENGKTFRDVLNECKRAPLDMLESTLKSALGLSSVKELATFQNRKESIQSRVEESELVCNKCPESGQSRESSVSGTDESPASSAVSARLSKLRLKTKSTGSASKKLSSQKLTSGSTSKQLSSQKKNSHGRLTKKDLRLHKLVFMDDVLPEGTEVAYYARGQRLLEGYVKGSSIFCSCCSSEVSPSQFEAHAGWASRRKPYLHIYTSNGVSLHELSVSLSKGRKFSANDNDDLCTICADGGGLVLCDGCPRAFHKDCAGLSSVPRGDWYCKYCQTLFEKEKAVAYNENAKAAGRVPGVDPIEQITKRCIRIVKTSEADLTVCVLCRSHDFSKAVFGPRTVMLCDQCEKEYHVGCLKDHQMADLEELPEGKWFCCSDCKKINTALEKLVLRGSEALPKSLSDVIRRKHSEKSSSDSADLDVRWRLLKGKNESSDSKLLLSKAVAIFHDCFDPIVDSATSRDLIPCVVYGRNMRDQEFTGMYCAVLTVNSSVVSAGILRIFGQELAELPLVATSSENQGKGYFQSLFSCIERLLGFLNVKNLLLPAADEAESIWTKKFGFKKISQDELSKLTMDSRLMTFQGTSILHKLVPKCRIVGRPARAS